MYSASAKVSRPLVLKARKLPKHLLGVNLPLPALAAQTFSHQASRPVCSQSLKLHPLLVILAAASLRRVLPDMASS